MIVQRPPGWKASLHGGHSAAYCEHARDSLRAILLEAAAQGFHTYGVTEHAPRLGAQYLYPEEVEKGYDMARLVAEFEAYADDLERLSAEFADRLVVLRGFETEVVPSDRYADIMRHIRRRFGFEYVVGSVHHVDDVSIDSTEASLRLAIEQQGGLEPLVIRYYHTVCDMVQALRPEVVGHLDAIRKLGHRLGPLDTPRIRQAAATALEAIRDAHGILDVNTSAYRRGMDAPYPAPWLVHMARDMGIPFCLGDDSHGVADVGAGFESARQYLLSNRVDAVAYLAREDGRIVHKEAPLLEAASI